MSKYSAPLDLAQCELRNAVTQNLGTAPGSPLAGQRYYDTVSSMERYWNGTRWIDLADSWIIPSAPVDFGGQRIVNLGAPTAATDAVTKAYADSVATGLDVKDSVIAASTGNVNVASPGAIIDGVTLAVGDRVLLKNQTAGAENGIYLWNGPAVALSRAPDADSANEVSAGLFTLVVGGTTNAGSGWILTTPDPIALGTTSLTFAQFSASSSYIGTPNRVTITGNQIDIASNYPGQASITTLGTIITGTWNGSAIPIANGGTGATTPAAARAALGTTGKFATSIGTGATTYTINHGLGTEDVVVRTYDSTKAEVFADVTIIDTDQIRIDFTNAPTAGAQVRVVVLG